MISIHIMLYIGWGKDGHVDGFICEVLNARNFTASHLCSFVRAIGLSVLRVHGNRE